MEECAMSWEDAYRDHAIWAEVRAASDELAEAIAQLDGQLDVDHLQLQALLAHMEACSENAHPAIAQAHLDSANAIINQIRTYLPQQIATVFARPGNGLSPFLKLAQAVRTWPAPGGVRLSGLGKRAEAVEQTFLALDEQINDRFDALKKELASAQEGFQESLDEHKTAVADASTAATSSISEQVTAVTAELERVKREAAEAEATTEKQKARLDKALTSHQEKFADLQEQRTQKWSELLTESGEKLEEHMSRMDAYEEQSRNVLAAVGVNATASDYEAYATTQAKIANRWRIGAVVAFAIAAIYFLTAAGMSFFGFGGESTWWEMVFQKIGAPGGAAAVGYFLQRESAQHRKQEREAKQVQLTLTALEPFIANLDPVEQRSIRMDTARDIFTRKRGATGPAGKVDQLDLTAPAAE